MQVADEAWAAAMADPGQVPESQWFQLIEMREQDHPADVIRPYQDLIEITLERRWPAARTVVAGPLRACCYRRGSAAAARSRATDPAATRAHPAAILGLRRCTARATQGT
jgi:hypothetical protein